MSSFSYVRIFITIATIVILAPFLLFAAESVIDSSIKSTAGFHNTSSPSLVFTTDQIGYVFYVDSTTQCVYSKTTDGGTSWGTAVVVDAQTDCTKVFVWYDRWTPGNTSGTKIHVGTIDGSDMWYTSLDTSSDTLSTTVNATGANQGGGFTNGTAIPSITESTTGVIYMGIQDASDSFVIKCSSSCSSASNWTEAGVGLSTFDLANDWLILLPLASGNIMAIRQDISADDVQSKVYTESSATWDASWTTIDANAPMDTAYDAGFGATVNPITNDVYLAYVSDNGTFGTNDDFRTALYSGGSWSAKTDILTNDTKGLVGVKLALNRSNGDLYAIYTARATANSASTGAGYYKRSTNGMTSWGSETQVISTSADYYGLLVNLSSDERIYAAFPDTTSDVLRGDTVADLTAPTYTQSAFRFFSNANSTDVGSALAAQDTAGTLSTSGEAFRLRMLLHVAGDGIQANLQNFKLQFVGKGSGSCASPSGGTPSSYTDVTALTAIAYNNNASPSDGTALMANGSDPTHSGHTVNGQTYEESNNFTNSQSAIASGADGKWDFSLIDNGAAASTAYCFRVVKSDGTVLDSYTVYPQVTTAAASDSTAPSAVSDLALSSPTTSSLLVSWTAPGDDAASGTATTYDLRYSTSLITAGNFSSATEVSGEPSPSVAGTSESMTVSGLSANTTYYFALKTSDEVPNTSSISNVPSGTTSASSDSTAPAAISTLSAATVGTTSIAFTWTAPGDDNSSGTAASYDFRYATSVITSGNFSSATTATGEPTPSVAGTTENFTLTGLASSTTYYFALKTSDEVPNTSAISNVVQSFTLKPVPVLSSISPISKLVNDSGFTLTLTGTDFSTTSVARFNGSSRTTTYVDSTELTATIPASDLLVAGSYPITVFTNTPGGGISGAQTFTVNATVDSTAPADTSNVAVTTVGANSVTLGWTSPGDDASTGTATSYDVRYSTSLITSGNFSSATAATGEPTPSVAGTTENFIITGLASSTIYYFALKTSDEVPNTSGISNVVSTTTVTSGDVTAPSAVSNLSASDTSTLSVTLTWTAPGDDGASGTATSYDVRYSTSEITAGNFSSASTLSGEPTPSVAGTSESMEVTGLDPSTTYYFALKTTDDASNSSTISNVISATTDSEMSASVFIPVANSVRVVPSSVIFSGMAYPDAQVRFYRKGNIDEGNTNNTYTPLTTARTDASGSFRKEFLALLSGHYLFSIEAKDKDGRSSGLYSFPVDLVNSNSVESKPIFLPPTFELQQKTVGRSGSLTIRGYAAPSFRVEAEVDGFLVFSTTALVDGSYTLSIPLARFTPKTHMLRMRQVESNGTRSRLSAMKSFTVSAMSYPRADVNNDGTIGISDLSVFLFHWKDRSKKFQSTLDMNGDGKVDIADFSIMLRALKK